MPSFRSHHDYRPGIPTNAFGIKWWKFFESLNQQKSLYPTRSRHFRLTLSSLWQGGVFHHLPRPRPHQFHVKTPTTRREIWRFLAAMADRITTSSKQSSPLGSFKYLSQTSVTDTAAGNVRKKQRLPLSSSLPARKSRRREKLVRDGFWETKNWIGAKCQISHQILLTNLPTLKSNSSWQSQG